MKLNIKTIKDIQELKGKKVILRLDLNVPIKDGVVGDDFRIQKALPIIDFLRKEGAIILAISHLDATAESLKAVADYLNEKFPESSVTFEADILSEESKNKIEQAKSGEMILFENIRNHPEEEKNDQQFARRIAGLGDLYVNDAFPVSHREHASIVGIPKFLPHYAGLQMEEEIKNLSFSEDLPRPFLFILGGAKFTTKLPLIQKFLDKADKCYIAGALANDFFKAKGYEVGISSVSEVILDQKVRDDSELVLPIDVVVKKGEKILIKLANEVEKDEKIVDAGPQSLSDLSDLINKAKLILWNGPLGFYEAGFNQPTLDLAKMIADSSAKSILGGGDTIAAIESLGMQDKFTFVSTGGGAMLEFLLNDTLPGIEALR